MINPLALDNWLIEYEHTIIQSMNITSQVVKSESSYAVWSPSPFSLMRLTSLLLSSHRFELSSLKLVHACSFGCTLTAAIEEVQEVIGLIRTNTGINRTKTAF